MVMASCPIEKWWSETFGHESRLGLVMAFAVGKAAGVSGILEILNLRMGNDFDHRGG